MVLLLVAFQMMLTMLPQSSQARWRGGSWSYREGSDCRVARERIDPIGAIFHGTAATWNFLGSYDAGQNIHNGHIQKHTGWFYKPGKGQQRMAHSDGCYLNIGSMGKAKNERLDYHARFWPHIDPPTDQNGTHHVIAATPHMDEHDHGACDGDHVPRHMNLPVGGTGSGYDYARQRLYLAMKTREDRHFARTEYWGNTAPMNQCGGAYQAHSSGHVSIIRVGKQ